METTDAQKKRGKHDANSAFIRVPNRAILDTDLKAKDLAVLLAICSFANNQTDECFPSRAAIAERARYNRAQEIDESVKKLEARGYIAKVYRGHKETSNLYKVLYDAADAVLEPALKLPQTKKKTPAKKQKPGISDNQFAISHWIATARKHNVHYTPNDRDTAAVNELLKQFPLDELQDIMTFMWDIWEAPAKVQKSNMDIKILQTGYAQGIVNYYDLYKKTRKLNHGAVTRELGAARNEAAATMSAEKKNTPDSANDTNESNLIKKTPRVTI